MRPLLVYIHGFNSSPLSVKAEQTRQYVIDQQLPIDFVAPALADYPGEAYRQVQELITQAGDRPIGIVGSSMGGFLAMVIAEEFGLRAVLINPVVRPHLLMGAILGESINPCTGQSYCLEQSHVKEVLALTPEQVQHPERLLVMVQTDDEILDYRRAVEYYQGSQLIIEQGGGHSFQGYKNHLPDIIKFLELLD